MSLINQTQPEALLELSDSEEMVHGLLNNDTICADELINQALEGLSGRILWGTIQIILMILGNIGNILTLVVLKQRLMRKSGVNNLLQGLAINDIVAPTLACIPHIMYYYRPFTNSNIIIFVNLYIMPIATGATFCSNWIVVTITSFRLMVVVKPLYSQLYCSARNERKALVIIFIFGVLSITPYYYFRTHEEAKTVIKVISAVLSILGPWVICVILWIVLIRIVSRKIGLKKSKQFTFNSEIVAQRLKSKSKITRMVLVICFFNIVCQLPVLVLTIFGHIDGNPCGNVTPFIFVGLLFLSNLLLILNHSINIIIYSITNLKFRYTLRMIFCRCFRVFHSGVKQNQMIMILKCDEQRMSPSPNTNTARYLKAAKSQSPKLLVATSKNNSMAKRPHRHGEVDL